MYDLDIPYMPRNYLLRPADSRSSKIAGPPGQYIVTHPQGPHPRDSASQSATYVSRAPFWRLNYFYTSWWKLNSMHRRFGVPLFPMSKYRADFFRHQCYICSRFSLRSCAAHTAVWRYSRAETGLCSRGNWRAWRWTLDKGGVRKQQRLRTSVFCGRNFWYFGYFDQIFEIFRPDIRDISTRYFGYFARRMRNAWKNTTVIPTTATDLGRLGRGRKGRMRRCNR